MTTSKRPGKPTAGEQPAKRQTAPGGTAPDDEQELRHEIEQTREQLGETVEQLAAKTDVKSQARAKAAAVTGRVKDKTAQIRAKAGDGGAGVRSQAAGKTAQARQQATAAKNQIQARASGAWQAAPEDVRRTVAKGASTANQRRAPLAVAAAVLITGYLVFRWWRRR
jgi:cobalamin biosynthesis Mg chelatase CobN